MLKKLLATVLALACALSINVTAFAATTGSIIGNLVDDDGNLAESSSQNIKPGSDYYYVIGESNKGYDILTDRNIITFTLKKKEGGKNISGGEILERKFGNGSTRYVCVKFTVKDSYSSSEYKLVLEANFRARKDLIADPVANPDTTFPIFKLANGSVGGTPVTEAELERLRQVWIAAQTAATNANNALAVAAKNTQDAKLKWEAADAVEKGTTDTDKTALDNARKAAETAKDAYDAAVAVSGAATTALSTAQTARATAVTNLAAADAALTTLKQRQLDITAIVGKFGNAAATAEDAIAANTLITAYNTAYATVLGTALADTDLKAVVTGTAYETENTTTVPGLTTAQTTKKTDNSTIITNFDKTDGTIGSIAQLTADAATKLAAVQTELGKKNLADQALFALLNKPVTLAVSNAADLKAVYDNLELDRLSKKVTADTANGSEATAKNAYNAARQNVVGTGYLPAGQTKTVTFSVWIQNEQRTDSDAVLVVGEKGVVIRPVKNDINTVTWETANGDIVARMTFTADSDANFFCPTLSSKMDSKADYYDYFLDRDAYMYNFVGSPRIPASTRASLSLYNPFNDYNDGYSKRVRDLYVYQLKDGELSNVTDNFTATTNDDGDEVLTTRTITLGTYIVTDRAIRKIDRPAKPNDNIDTGILYPNGNKPIPNTGR